MSVVADRPRSGARYDLRMVARQVYYEQLNFWLNPVAALFTVGFSIVFLILLASSAGSSHSSVLGGQKVVQYYVPGFIAYGLMSTCFNSLSTQLVVRREMGLLKRLRLSPLPTWAFLSAVFINAVIISIFQVVVLLLIGRFGYQVTLPQNYLAFAVTLIIGAASFTALGVAVSTLVPNQEAVGPIVSIVFFVLLFLSGLWYPLDPTSSLAKISSWFPIRHMIIAIYTAFNRPNGVSGWSGRDLLDLGIWGAIGVFIALRRWSWAPRRADPGRRRIPGVGLRRGR